MKRKRLALTILPSFILAVVVVLGPGPGCNSNNLGGGPSDGGMDAAAPSAEEMGSSCSSRIKCSDRNANCGLIEDGCGGIQDCGTCPAGQTCGGGGTFFQCGGNTSCMPLTQAQACGAINATCGEASDGCGGTISCGSCTGTDTCGGGGVPFQCGTGGGSGGGDGGTSCMPITCAQVGSNCGTVGDGCGGTLDCGTCTAPATCGGGGVAGQCGSPICVPRTCAEAGANCGFVGDGCGGIINYGGGTGPGCGTCAAGQLCGGGGVPNVCSTPTPTCTNLCTKVATCDAGTTQIKGTVTAPGHDNTTAWGNPDPVPGALVYIPNGTVMPLTSGVSCVQCGGDVTGSPLRTATTQTDGTFTLDDVPCGVDVPVVIQLGRWRRQVTIPAVQCCTTTTLTNAQTHLPRNKSEGDIPSIAVVTGSADPMECVLPKIGIDLAEFTDPSGNGRVHFYQASTGGAGATLSAATPKDTALFSDLNQMKKYDLIIIDCEGDAYDKSNYYNNLLKYTAAGGRIYLSHYGYSFLHGKNQTAPPALNTAWDATATWKVNQTNPPDQTGYIDQTFPKGITFANWLNLVAGGTLGQVPVKTVRHDFNAVIAPSQQWMYGTRLTKTTNGNFPLHYTFNTPVGSAPTEQCGRVMYSDFHVNTGASSSSTATFPAECNLGTGVKMSAQEKVLEFMLFDLTSCIKADVPVCTPKTCAELGYNCGQQGDGCGGILDCGMCTSPQVCGGAGVPGVCGGGCTPTTCAALGANCGTQANGCGGTLNCGTCTAPQTCGGGGMNKCGNSSSCTPLMACPSSIKCGTMGDGCGGTLNCGTCTAPQTCGGGGTPGVCGAPTCTPRTCAQANANCGTIGDGCGGTLDCGTCPVGSSCGVLGVPNQCGNIG